MVLVRNVGEEMQYMEGQIDLLRAEVVGFANSELKTNVLAAIDRWKQDVANAAPGSIGFFDTIPYFDRLDSIGGLVVMLRNQQMVAAAEAVSI